MLESPSFVKWIAKFAPEVLRSDGSPPINRKFWEWGFIVEALSERGCLQPGKRGLGFAVGKETMPALFAGLGCEIVATDRPSDDSADVKRWESTNQHANTLKDLLRPDLCPDELFAQRVQFRAVDMNHLPSDLCEFDFCWSACAFEHLGSLIHGMKFVEASIDCLKPGGVAVHTTEFNLSSNTLTPDTGPNVIYRRCDIDGLIERLRSKGHDIEIDYSTGEGVWDHQIDFPPYDWEHHLKLLIMGFVSTSLGLIITKDANAMGRQKARVRLLWSKVETVIRRPFRAVKRRLT